MSRKNEFADYVVELLSPHGTIKSKAMFGGYGIYCDDLFIAIIVDDTLFFKTNEQTRARFIEEGSKPFVYQSKDRRVAMAYYEVPSDAVDSSDAVLPWLNLALQAALNATPKKSSRANKK